MVRYQKRQKQLIEEIELSFKENRGHSEIVDMVDDYATDNRICLTVVSFISPALHGTIKQKLIQPLRECDPSLYYYLSKSLHVTIQNVRTIHNPPAFSQRDIKIMKEVLQKVALRHNPFEFYFQGLFELPTSLSIPAYSEEILSDLILDIREEMNKHNITDNKKYHNTEVMFGNVTISRFPAKPNKDFFQKVQKLKKMDIGKTTVKEICLISTNAVCHPSKTTIHGTYRLQ
ncbi:MAG: hypothetical protein Q8Q20_02735 [bacterium]|nr:hypothetical protein [bacterium]